MDSPPATIRLPIPTYGTRLLDRLPAGMFQRPIVLTQKEPWPLAAGRFDPARMQLHFVTGMEHASVRERSLSFGPASAVFGIGGGMALDHAKYTAWTTGLPLVLVPTILSVDAAYTKAIGVREGSRVRYTGQVWPDHLLIDFDLIRSAPPLLNRAGAGDILSIFTALWDWREAHARLGEWYDPDLAARSQALLDRLFASAGELSAGTDAGLHELSELFLGEVELCEIAGSSRPEEGSEHYLAYCLESITRRSYVHGQLIGACVLIAGARQGQNVAPVADYLRRLGLDCRLAAAGIRPDEMVAALLALDAYLAGEGQLLPGIFHFSPVNDEGEAHGLLSRLGLLGQGAWAEVTG